MTGIRKRVGMVLIGLGVAGVLLSIALMLYGLLFVPEMIGDKRLSESLVTLMIAAWCGGLVVAGRILRRK